MSDKVKERIEKEAHSLANDYTGDHNYNSGVFTGYVAGATAERPKAWNEALEEIKILFDTKLLPFDPVPGNILKIAKAVSEIYNDIQKLKHKQP